MSRAQMHYMICRRQTSPPVEQVAKGIIDEIQMHFPTLVIKPYVYKRNRNQEVVRARQTAMVLCKEVTGQTLACIGDYFGRDHATVLHAYRRIRNRKFDPDLEYIYDIASAFCKRQGWIHADV